MATIVPARVCAIDTYAEVLDAHGQRRAAYLAGLSQLCTGCTAAGQCLDRRAPVVVPSLPDALVTIVTTFGPVEFLDPESREEA